MPISFGKITKEKKRSLEDQTDYTPQNQQTQNYRLGLIYKTLDTTWGTNTSEKIREKLGKAKRWDLPVDLFKNVHCSFFTQRDPKDADKLVYMCKITFTFIQVVTQPEDEAKAIRQYRTWIDSIVSFIKKDASSDVYTGTVNKFTMQDVTKKYAGQEILIQRELSNLCQASTSNIGSHMPMPAALSQKLIYKLTKVYQLGLSD